MGFGLMNKKAQLCVKENTRDQAGFMAPTLRVLVSIRVFVEGRHGSETWRNLAAFSEATELFRFRVIPGVQVTTKQSIVYENHEYNILSVENVKGRNMYIEVLAKKVEASK